MKNETVYSIPLRGLEEHSLASLNPGQTEGEYTSMKLSIEDIGQTEPIVLFKGRVVDGRHRVKALRELEQETVKAIKLNNNLTLAHVTKVVLGSDRRRGATAAQKAIQAVRYMKSSDITQVEASAMFGVATPTITDIIKLEKSLGTDKINSLFRDGYLMFNNKKYINMRKLRSAIKVEEEKKNSKPSEEVVPKHIEDILSAISDVDDIFEMNIVIKHCKDVARNMLEV